MTIYEYDTVSAASKDEAQVPPVPSHDALALVDHLNAGEPYAVAFGGQGGAWLENLEELVSRRGHRIRDSEIDRSRRRCCWSRWPVSLLWCGRSASSRCSGCGHWPPKSRCPPPSSSITAAISGPGILLAQMAAIRALTRQGLDLYDTPPVAMAGHSQGIMACRIVAGQGHQGC